VQGDARLPPRPRCRLRKQNMGMGASARWCSASFQRVSLFSYRLAWRARCATALPALTGYGCYLRRWKWNVLPFRLVSDARNSSAPAYRHLLLRWRDRAFNLQTGIRRVRACLEQLAGDGRARYVFGARGAGVHDGGAAT